MFLFNIHLIKHIDIHMFTHTLCGQNNVDIWHRKTCDFLMYAVDWNVVVCGCIIVSFIGPNMLKHDSVTVFKESLVWKNLCPELNF